ncbi:STP1 protein [Plasmodium malariae]|uniref:STP1 protein n=1 Tax=Plasmodium malariae TaxID=5858 RepID=A0A1D3TDR4_PLAMA|nr:STP1 protein [Plasmodium malariae]SCP03080.1 STP1 protein [Plasmodium malariae]
MEKCLSLDLSVKGFGAFEFYFQPEFTTIRSHVQKVTRSLYNEDNKETFRNTCLELASYLIKNKTPSRYYMKQKERWEGALKDWVKSFYKPLYNEFGGCFPILEEKDKNLLELNYEALNFCDEMKKKKAGIQCLTGEHAISDSCDETCSNKIYEYNAWIQNEKMKFNKKKTLIESNCKKILPKFPTNKCNIHNPKTFNELPICTVKHALTTSQQDSPEKKTSISEGGQTIDSIPSELQVTKEQGSNIPHGKQEQLVQQDLQPQTETLSSTEASGTQGDTKKIQDSQTKNEQTSGASEHEEKKSSYDSTFPSKPEASVDPLRIETTASIPASIPAPLSPTPSLPHISSGQVLKKSNNYISSILISILTIIIFSFFIKYVLIGMFKKKKKIKRKQMKFLRIKVPSRFDRKSKFFTDDHLEHTIYDDEEIIKKIKINERKKKVNLSKQKKDRSKTIIEVHMEVLEECRNAGWEKNKEEFLKIFIDKFTKNEHNAYPNLTNDDLITENIKSGNDITKQNILWNKWIERHRYISEKLKKQYWFNNLKNEWKKELACMQEIEEIKKKSSNEKYEISVIEREKDPWKQWISKKGILIEQYLEQDFFQRFEEDFHNISDEYVNEDTKNYVTLINIEELQKKENYEELYKYIKKKLLAKLCIFVLLTILEECKKEVNFENRESYLDSCINEWKIEENADKKPEITENLIKVSDDFPENRLSNKIHHYTEEDDFKRRMEEWIREDDTYVNSIGKDAIIDKYNEIAEKYFL